MNATLTLARRLRTLQAVLQLTLNGMRWQVLPEFADALPHLLAAPGESVKMTPLKVIQRHRLEHRSFYVKTSFHGPAVLRSLGAMCLRPRNRVDWALARQVNDRQIEVVTHAAYGERWSWRGLIETALVTLAPEGYTTLHEVPDAGRPEIQSALGHFLLRMHEAGVALRDLHAKNLLYSAAANAFCLVDLDTVTVRSRVSLATRVDHLARLHYRVPLSAHFYDAYNKFSRVDPDAVARLAPLQRRSRCLKSNRDFDRIELGGLSWWVRRQSLTLELRSILEAPDAFLEREARLLKRESHSIVGSGHAVVVKRVRGRGPLGLLKGLFRWPPARRVYRKAYHLELAGIPSARPVAVSARRVCGFPTQSYFVMEGILGATHLHMWRGEWRKTVRDVAELVARLHRAGFGHRDLKETNIVFDQAGRPNILDLDGLEFFGQIPRRRAVHDLARLLRGAARSFTLTRFDLARFLVHYCEVRGEPAWRNWWQALAANETVVRVLSTPPCEGLAGPGFPAKTVSPNTVR